MMSIRILAALLFVSTALPAAEVVRSIDQEGNITFSDQPVKDSVESSNIKIDAPAPPVEELTESQQEAQDIIQKANQIPSSQDKEQAAVAAEKNLAAAQAKLDAAKVVGEGDRKGTASGGSRLTPGYLERVENATNNVERAQEQLDKARSGH